MDVSRVGINPLNGSDAFENPDGDGYDINHNGIIEQNEVSLTGQNTISKMIYSMVT